MGLNKMNSIKGYNVGMDVLCELTCAIVERQWYQNSPTKNHSYIADNGDNMYIDEVQDEFNQVLGLVELILNGEEL